MNARARVLAVFAVLAAAPVAAQSGPETVSEPVGRAEVVDRLLTTNADVARAALAIDRARSERAGAVGVLDPVFDARLELSHARTPTQAGLSAGIATNDRYSLSASIGRMFSPGTRLTVSLSQAVTRSEFPLRTGFGFGDQTIVSGPDVETALTVEVRQPFLRGFGRRQVLLGDRIAARNIVAREADALGAASAAVLEAMVAYTELRYAHEELALRHRSLERTEQALQIAEAEAEAGQIAPIEVDLVREQVAMRTEAVLVARVELASRSRALARALGDSATTAPRYAPTDPLTDPAPIAIDAAVCAAAADANPSIATLRAQRELAVVRSSGTRDAMRPSLEASAGLTQQGLDGGWAESVEQALTYDAPTLFGGVVFSAPLRNRAARAEHEVAMADITAAEFEIEEAERALCFEIEDAAATLALQRERLDLAELRVSLSERGVDAERERFASGLSTVQAGLDALETLEGAEIALVRVRTDAELAWWQLEFVRGRLLETLPTSER